MIAQYESAMEHSENAHVGELSCKSKAAVLRVIIECGSMLMALYKKLVLNANAVAASPESFLEVVERFSMGRFIQTEQLVESIWHPRIA